MADFGTPEQMAAFMQQMQQQMQQMQELQQTIAAQQLAAQREAPVPIGTRKLRKNQPSTKINYCHNGRLWHSRTDAAADAIDARVAANNRSAATGCTAGTTCPNW
ncbi:hypothetical protein F2Q69_00040965 [Brassica cretica]|uniref:Uncharacterized protein n=1 Tax=Brassica cretica TaxID=69181 RepID=A0A8S9NS09_BRACR|nr:hypothetical protein F2Q69_00040965 [Brassica cretica]